MRERRTVALIGTGGTISAVGAHAYDLIDYDANGVMLDAQDVLTLLPSLPSHVDVTPIPFCAMSSTGIYFAEWQALVAKCAEVAETTPGLAGIVITHGTASMEETAYFLHLTLKVKVPVVLVGSQRPNNSVSSDACLNLYNAIRVAAEPAARGLGVLVVLNDEIHAARDVTKTSTYRLHAFQSPNTGPLGCCDADTVALYRRPVRLGYPNTEFDVADLTTLPKVGIAYSYTGSDGEVVDSLVASGALGVVVAGFAPGVATPGELQALERANSQGVVVVMSSRAGSGRVGEGIALSDAGQIASDNLNPQKARLLLALALTRTNDKQEISRIFRVY